MIIPNIWENKKWQPNHQPVVNTNSTSGGWVLLLHSWVPLMVPQCSKYFDDLRWFIEKIDEVSVVPGKTEHIFIHSYRGFLKWWYPQSSSIWIWCSLINHPAIGSIGVPAWLWKSHEIHSHRIAQVSGSMDVNPSDTGWSWTDDNFAMGWAALDTSPRDGLVYFETPKWLGSSLGNPTAEVINGQRLGQIGLGEWLP